MSTILRHFASTVKEVAMFAKSLTWKEIIKVALFVNLCVLPIVLAMKW